MLVTLYFSTSRKSDFVLIAGRGIIQPLTGALFAQFIAGNHAFFETVSHPFPVPWSGTYLPGREVAYLDISGQVVISYPALFWPVARYWLDQCPGFQPSSLYNGPKAAQLKSQR